MLRSQGKDKESNTPCLICRAVRCFAGGPAAGSNLGGEEDWQARPEEGAMSQARCALLHWLLRLQLLSLMYAGSQPPHPELVCSQGYC